MTVPLSDGRAIAVIGGSIVPRSDVEYETAQELGAALAVAGYEVLTGGDFGLAEAASEAARKAGGQTSGVTVSSFDPKPASEHLTDRLHAQDLHERIRQVIHRSCAVVVLPGGLGTLVEVTTIWLLKQVEQLPGSFPIVVLDRALYAVLKRAAQDLLMPQSDIKYLHFARHPAEALYILKNVVGSQVVSAPVTIGIAAWNAATYIEAAVTSALSQTVRPTEVIVVDDGSDDDTATLVQRLRTPSNGLTLIRQENRGTASALNRAMGACSTRHLLGLDADDMLLPQAIERFWEHAKRYPDAAMIYSDHVIINESGIETGQRSSAPPEDLLDRLRQLHEQLAFDNTDNFLPAGHGRLYDVERILSMGGYATDFRYAEDFDLVVRIAELWQCVHIPEVLYKYRWHTTNKGIWGRQGQLADVRESFRRHLWRTASEEV